MSLLTYIWDFVNEINTREHSVDLSSGNVTLMFAHEIWKNLDRYLEKTTESCRKICAYVQHNSCAITHDNSSGLFRK
jgi:hypothetical protein